MKTKKIFYNYVVGGSEHAFSDESELDFWAVANPFLKNWFKERYSVKGLIKYLVSKKHILTYMIIKKIEETQEVYSELNGER